MHTDTRKDLFFPIAKKVLLQRPKLLSQTVAAKHTDWLVCQKELSWTYFVSDAVFFLDFFKNKIMMCCDFLNFFLRKFANLS